MTTAYLVVTRDQEGFSLHSSRASPPAELTTAVHDYRISPIFAVFPKEAVLPNADSAYYLTFLFYEQAFLRLGQIITFLPPEVQKALWFSHGLASVILFSTDLEVVQRVRAEHGDGLRAAEIWRVEGRRIAIVEQWLCPTNIDSADYSIVKSEGLDPDLLSLLIELQHDLNRAAKQAAQFIPSQLIVYKRLARAVSQIVQELIFLQHPDDSPPSFLQDKCDSLRRNPVARQMRINALTDYIVQINSAISYVISQGYSGACPILDNHSLYASFSLLGVGTAFCAINAIARRVERVFEQYPIYETVKREYAKIAGTDVFRTPRDFNPTAWECEDVQIDTYLKDATPVPPKPHLLFYSGRLGFQEAPFSVSGAMQALSNADSVRWSLITLTHELMHAHVREILAAIFSTTDPSQLSEEAFRESYEGYQAYMRNGYASGRWKLQQCLRFAIFNFCIFQDAYERLVERCREPAPEEKGKKAKERVELEWENRELLRESLVRYFKLINEIMVHVLDYFYFYNGKPSFFLDTIWESWCTVPVVLVNLEHYLLRSITTVSTTVAGTLRERFETSLGIVKERLGVIEGNKPGSVVIRGAMEILSDRDSVRRLWLMFQPALYLADATRCFLKSSRIHAALISDTYVRATPDGYEYSVEIGEFPGFEVKSPVALVADRVRRILSGETGDGSALFRAGWLLLACASFK